MTSSNPSPTRPVRSDRSVGSHHDLPGAGRVPSRGASFPSEGRVPSRGATAFLTQAVTLLLLVLTPSRLFAAPAAPDFTREVRPIHSRHSFKCHGPDETTRKAKLRLDERDSALKPAKSGAVALVPGKPEASELIARIVTDDPDEIMPPPSTKVPLTAAEKDILQRWVKAGGEYKAHWAFVPPTAVAPPQVNDTSWPRTPLDRFVLSRLEKEKLRPAPPADPYTLIRRVSYDLTGLPPTPEEADAFAANPTDAAYEALVDRLLSSPLYGERWGRRWLDLARYADTNGYEKDRNRSIWPWRDWVIRALNDDMPFDRFTIEQFAGDLLPNPTRDQIIATGFHRNTMLNEEGGIDPLEFRFHAMTDRVATTGTAWLGLTLGCAQCHTHKYDPIQHREYYGVMAFLNNADEPDFDLPEPGWEAKHKARLAQAAQILADLPNRLPVGTRSWTTPKLVSATSASGETPALLEDQSALFAGTTPEHDTYTLVVETDASGTDALRLETLADDRLPAKGPGRVKHGNFVLSEITVTAAPKSNPTASQPVTLTRAEADIEQSGFPIAHAIDGNTSSGWAIHNGDGALGNPHWASFQFDKPVSFPGGTRFTIRLDHRSASHHLVGRPRISLAEPSPDSPSIAERRREVITRRFEEWLAKERSRTVQWTPLRPHSATSNLPLLTVEADDAVFVSGDITKLDTYDLGFRTSLRGITAVRLEALPDDRLPRHGPGLAYYEGPKGDFFMTEFTLTANGTPVKFGKPTASYARNNFGSTASAGMATDGDPQTGWSTAGREGERHVAIFPLETPLADGGELSLRMLFGRHYACSLGRFRISVTTAPGEILARDFPDGIEDLLLIPDAQLTAAQRQSLMDMFLLAQPEFAKARDEISRLRKPPTHTTTLVFRERPSGNTRPTFLHKRGEYLQPTDRIDPSVLSAVAPFPPELPVNRLGFARWLVSSNNPLTARVTVNRQWQAFFARGIVRTTEDFGLQGEAPSHPELLDWLAIEFMKQGWSLKKLHRLIVLSATYRQSSRVPADVAALDPDNHLLSRGPQVRLEAEIIRDAALRASGLLSAKMGGPGVYPPQPAGVTDVAYGGGAWNASEGEDRHRRSVYTFTKRTAPFAMFNTFDAPTGESCIARRDVSNTPLQALTLLNDVFFMEASQAMGRLLATQPGSDQERIRIAFRRCLTRPPAPAELDVLTRFLQTQRSRFTSGQLDPAPVAGPGGRYTCRTRCLDHARPRPPQHR